MSTFGNLLFFARNWTISNLRLMSGAMGIGTEAKGLKGRALKNEMVKKLFPKSLKHEGLTGRQLQVASRMYQHHLTNSFSNIAVMYGLMQWFLMHGVNYLHEKGVIDGPVVKPKDAWGSNYLGFIGNLREYGPTAFDRIFDFRTGVIDNEGKEILLNLPFYRYMRDIAGWVPGFEGPRKMLLKKLNPLLKGSIELLTMKHLPFGQDIIEPGAPVLEQFKQGALHIAGSFTPVAPVATLYEWTDPGTRRLGEILLPFAGATWPKRSQILTWESYRNQTSAEDKQAFRNRIGQDAYENDFMAQMKTKGSAGEYYAKEFRKFKQEQDWSEAHVKKEARAAASRGDLGEAQRILREGGLTGDQIRRFLQKYRYLKRWQRQQKYKRKRTKRSPYIGEDKLGEVLELGK
jgi:hypothetical protein